MNFTDKVILVRNVSPKTPTLLMYCIETQRCVNVEDFNDTKLRIRRTVT